MLKVKRNYVYAQIKIDRKVKDFYVCNLDFILTACRSDIYLISDKLEKTLKSYCSDLGITHKFQKRLTLFGVFSRDVDKIRSNHMEHSQKVGYKEESIQASVVDLPKMKRLSDFNYDLVAYANYRKEIG